MLYKWNPTLQTSEIDFFPRCDALGFYPGCCINSSFPFIAESCFMVWITDRDGVGTGSLRSPNKGAQITREGNLGAFGRSL